jgi:peptidoglycan-N-acetylglucosamine deacetylase
MRDSTAIVWPGGARVAAALTFDFDAEEVWLSEDPANASRPGRLSQGTYGARVAVPEILALLDRHRLRVTFFIPGRVAERHPGRVELIAAAGHEIALHGYTHTSPGELSRDEEEAELVRSIEVLSVHGGRPTGYRSPSWEFSSSTIELLAAHGLRYSSNFMDDVRPYRHDSGLVELPVHWSLDDAAHFWFDPASWEKTIQPTSVVEAIWREELDGLRVLGGASCIYTMHPQIIGRPGRLLMLERLIEHLTGLDDVWVAGCDQIAAAVPSS